MNSSRSCETSFELRKSDRPHVHASARLLAEAAEVAPVSIDALRRAVHATDPTKWPHPLKAKRLGPGVNAKVIVLATDLKECLEHLHDA